MDIKDEVRFVLIIQPSWCEQSIVIECTVHATYSTVHTVQSLVYIICAEGSVHLSRCIVNRHVTRFLHCMGLIFLNHIRLGRLADPDEARACPTNIVVTK